ncbi:MAG: LacI family DNA-binding transcriptional regulator [Opitutaceae bacterium]|nr:LacI family DNA-binding transcriptional regulator [Opitutaceae bacterium]
MSLTPPTVTQRDVALACGVHASTICLALKDAPSLPLETRRRIQETARALGYQPNAAARNLALLRSERNTGGSLPIAWINQEPKANHWRTDPEASPFLTGARRRATELGYRLEEFWAREPGMSVARLTQILTARGLGGALLPVHRAFDFSLLHPGWETFSLVGLNDHRLGEWADVVCPDYYHNQDLVLRQLRRQGGRRVGLVLPSQRDAATQGVLHGGFLRHQAEMPVSDRVPVCFVSGDRAERSTVVDDWIRDHHPEAVVCWDREVAEEADLQRYPIRWYIPQGGGAGEVAGVDDRPEWVGAVAVECLVGKMRHFEKGLRGPSRMHLVRGTAPALAGSEVACDPVVA